MISKHILLITFLNEPELAVKCFQVLLSIPNNSVKR